MTDIANNPTTTTIELLGKPFQIKCPENEVSHLQKAADYLNQTLDQLPNSGKIAGPEKLGIMAALNLASQLLKLEQQFHEQKIFLNQRLHHIQSKLETVLATADPTPAFRLEIEPAQA